MLCSTAALGARICWARARPSLPAANGDPNSRHGKRIRLETTAQVVRHNVRSKNPDFLFLSSGTGKVGWCLKPIRHPCLSSPPFLSLPSLPFSLSTPRSPSANTWFRLAANAAGRTRGLATHGLHHGKVVGDRRPFGNPEAANPSSRLLEVAAVHRQQPETSS